jgi:anti-sigma factor RsiW
MRSCAECSELLLDYLYDLLDEQEAQQVRDHLATCADCQDALSEAKKQQNLLATAARKCREVPMFEAPAEAVLSTPTINSPLEKQQPAVFPLPARRPSGWRRWLAVGAAAAVVIAIGAGYRTYQNGLATRMQTLAAVHGEIDDIDGKLAALARESPSENENREAAVQQQFLHTQIVGPATVQRGVANSYRLLTQTPLGEPSPADVSVKVLAQAPGQEAEQVQFSQSAKASGELQVVLPSTLAVQSGTKARLVVEANNGQVRDVIEQPLTVAEPTYATHIALNKSAFRAGETVLFRTVTLERFALTPIDRPVPLNFTLYRLAGKILEPVKRLQCTTGAGGVGGGEFVVGSELVPGEYVFALDSTEPTAEQPFRLRTAHRAIRVESSEIVKREAEKLPEAPAVKSPTAEFFPEGGELVTGVTNRVYVRLQGLQSATDAFAGFVEDSRQKRIAEFRFAEESRHANPLLGSFTFSPKAGEAYIFGLTSGDKVLSRHPMPAVAASGISLSVPQAVVPAGQSIVAKIRGPEHTPLLVLVNCRGRIVDQKIVTSAAEVSDITLDPAPGSHGVMRMTVYAKDGENWRPAAERLVYRQPREFLKLSAAVEEPAARKAKADDSVKMRIESRNENDALTPAWIYALVTEEASPGKSATQETSLPAYFLLTTSLPEPEGLDDADVLLTDSPAAAKALDLFLGTAGWRRFVPQAAAEPTLVAENQKDAKGAEPTLFIAGTNLDAVQSRYTRALREQQAERGQDIERQRFDLRNDRESAAYTALLAAAAIEEYQQRPMIWLRYGTALSLIVLLAAGVVLILVGLIVAIRARSSPRSWLVSSCGVLLAAILLFGGTSSLRHGGDSEPAPGPMSWLVPRDSPIERKESPLDHVARAKVEASKTTVQVFARSRSSENQGDLDIARELGGVQKEQLDRQKHAEQPLKAAAKAAAGAGFGAKGGGGSAAPPLQGLPQTQTLNSSQSEKNFANQALPGQQGKELLQSDKKSLLVETTGIREYSMKKAQTGFERQGMLLWRPLINATDGAAHISFDPPAAAAKLRVLVYGHTADGRLGVYRSVMVGD